MLERKKYNEELDRVRSTQAKDLAEYLEHYIELNAKIRDLPICPETTEEVLNRVMGWEIPRKGRDPKVVGEEIVQNVFYYSLKVQHPRFFSLVASAVSPYSLAGSILTDIYNPNAAGYDGLKTGSLIEEKITKWMGSRAGWDTDKCAGVFTSGGSLSNLTCMIAARETKLGRDDLTKGVAFYSDQAHSSIIKGMHMMGLRNDNCVKIESDDKFKMDVVALEKEIIKAKEKGLKPFLMIGTIATTNTGSIDPLEDMAALAKKYDMWLHVDGAYGGSVLISDIYNHLAKGIELADSLSWDTHKWAMQTYSCSCALCKDQQTFLNTFIEHPEYLADVTDEEHHSGWDLGIEMSRPARFIKFWYTLQCMGTDLLADVIDYSFFNSKEGFKKLMAYGDWRAISEPCCGTFNARYEPKDIAPEHYDELNARITQEVNKDGYAYILNTTLKGQKVIRFCCIGGNTETEDVLNAMELLNTMALKVKSEFK